jgi:DNA-binding SARP family transcriptional activator
VLGDLQIARDGETVAMPASKRTRALLGYLIATGAPQTRQNLCDLLWDGPDDPRAALRWSLTKLRPLLNDREAERLSADRERIRFAARDAVVDLYRVQALSPAELAAADVDTLEALVGLLAGEFLDGLDLPNCHRFHQWCLAERERLGTLRMAALSTLLDRLADAPERALPHARAMVGADPLSETAHARLVRLLGQLGRLREAEAHCEHAKRMLGRELAAPLSGELSRAASELHPKLRERRSAQSSGDPPRPPLAKPSAGPAARPLLVGRSAEHAEIEAAVAGLVAGEPQRAFFFLGEPGIGKTRLLEDLAETARAKGCRVLASRAFEAEMVRPYGCWLDALRTVPKGALSDETVRGAAILLPSGRATDDGDRGRLFAAVGGLVGELAQAQPLLLVFDDIQWIDEASASLLHNVLRNAPASRFLFAAGARKGEIDENPSAKRLRQSLLRDRLLREVRLSPLTPAEVETLLGRVAPGVDAAPLSRESGGNPLFAIELARARRGGAPATESTLDELIAGELARLDDPARELLTWAAATGRAFPPEVLASAIGIPASEVLNRLERVEARGLLRPAPGGLYDFSHDLVRQATYRTLSQPRRRLIHRQIARAFETMAASDESLAGDVAHHAALGEDYPLALRASVAAGERALRMFANAEAAELAERGLALLLRIAAGAERARLHLALLSLKVVSAASPGLRRAPELQEELKAAIASAEAEGLHSEAAHGLHLLSWLIFRANDSVRAREASLEAERASRAADEETRCRQLANTARCLMEVEVDVEGALTLARQADDLAEKLSITFTELEWAHGLLLRWQGKLGDAGERVARALDLARVKEDHWREYQCLIWLATIELELGLFDLVERHSIEVEEAGARMGDGASPTARAYLALARLARAGGDAASEAAAIAGLREIDDKAHLAYVLNQFAAAHLDAERFEAAERCASEGLAVAETMGRTSEVAVANSILACAAAARSDRRAAAGYLKRLAPSAAGTHALNARALAFLDRAAKAAGIPTLVQTRRRLG